MLIGLVRGVRVLCEVAAQGSFSAAARSLGMTQSAVSQHVAALEREAGTALVDRGTRPMELTEAGSVLVRHGRVILAQLDGAEQALAAITGRRAGRLRLGSFPTALTTFVPEAVRTLRATAPELVLTVVDDHMQGLVPRLTAGELDLAVVYENPSLPDDSLARLTTVPLFDDPYRVLLPEGHRLARRRRPLSLADLTGEVWVGGRPGSAWFRILLHACRASGFEPRTLLTTDDHRAVQAFVAAGLGIGVVPGLAASFPSPGVVVRGLDTGAPVRRIAVARPPGEPVPPPVVAMTEVLLDVTRARRDPRGAPRRA
ncbi:LysR family transcriptional regulator [Nocardioides humi]|uniref:LysR family transcriptional regulator n=1 Tax=Nocardioides humi TaxID=449461 RepID=A0ABN1ZRY7_9ACTN|nr:LysR family transcriptional regulator [Nocardioides humi]